MSTQPRAMSDLLLVLFAPIVWALHFFALYLIEALWCAAAGPSAGGHVRTIGTVITAIALAALAAFAVCHRRGFRRHSHETAGVSDELAKYAALLAILSIIAVLWASIPLFVFPACVPSSA